MSVLPARRHHPKSHRGGNLPIGCCLTAMDMVACRPPRRKAMAAESPLKRRAENAVRNKSTNCPAGTARAWVRRFDLDQIAIPMKLIAIKDALEEIGIAEVATAA
ncbi:hypothetical protein RHEC894_PC00339 (plasmid) [Rhizobium sp. CIAT894]|nr:hypothetical protein RHEC894_PC00339 [Rhizobium sp. CIAT894]